MLYEENKTFVVTFSEALNISDEDLKKALQEKLRGTTATIEMIEWQDTEKINDWDRRELLIQFKDEVDVDFTINMNLEGTQLVTDFAGYFFGQPTAEYKMQNMVNFKVTTANLTGTVSTGTGSGEIFNLLKLWNSLRHSQHRSMIYDIIM